MPELTKQLPTDFTNLELYADKWALATEQDRVTMRCTSSMAELTEFYDAMLPRMRDIIAHLNAHTLDHLADPEKRLLQMAFSFMEVAMAVEVFKAPDEEWAFPTAQYQIEEATRPGSQSMTTGA